MNLFVRACVVSSIMLVPFACGGDENTGSANGDAVCGNGIREGDEECDQADRSGATCQTATLNPSSSGTLGCTTECTFDVSLCSGGVGTGGTSAGGAPAVSNGGTQATGGTGATGMGGTSMGGMMGTGAMGGSATGGFGGSAGAGGSVAGAGGTETDSGAGGSDVSDAAASTDDGGEMSSDSGSSGDGG